MSVGNINLLLLLLIDSLNKKKRYGKHHMQLNYIFVFSPTVKIALKTSQITTGNKVPNLRYPIIYFRLLKVSRSLLPSRIPLAL